MDEIPFEDVLRNLTGDEPVSIPLLFHLSDLDQPRAEAFAVQWALLPVERRRVVARHLADLMEENFQVDFLDVLQTCLRDEDPEVRIAGLDGLWDTTSSGVVGQIIDLLNDDSSEDVRVAAAGALAHYVVLGEWGQVASRTKNRVVTALLAQIDAGPPRRVYCAALEAIGAAGHPRVSGLIAAAYDSGEPDLQLSAVFAMGNSADERWLPTVLQEMENYDEAMRIEAARAAGVIGRSDAVPQLAELLYDDNDEVAFAAIGALGLIGSGQARELLEALRNERENPVLLEAIDDALEEMDLLPDNFEIHLFDFEAEGRAEEDED